MAMNRETFGRTNDSNNPDKDRNPDAITGAPGSHPVGTGVGAAAAGAAGAAIGSVVPGVGTVIGGAVGAVVGAVAGGYAGKGVAEAINPTEEDAYWRNEHRNRPYAKSGASYDTYAPAYKYGYTSAAHENYQERDWSDVEGDLEQNWNKERGGSTVDWADAKPATRDAWDRAKQRMQDYRAKNRS